MKDNKNIQTPKDIIEYELFTNENNYIEVSNFLRKWNDINPKFKKRIDSFFSLKRTLIYIDDLIRLYPNELPYIRIKGKTDKYGYKTPDIIYMSKPLFLEFKLWLHPRMSIRILDYISKILSDNTVIRKEKYIVEIPILNDSDEIDLDYLIRYNGKTKVIRQPKKYTVIHQYSSKNGKLLGIYNSIDEAVKKTKKSYTDIENALVGGYNRTNYIWKYNN